MNEKHLDVGQEKSRVMVIKIDSELHKILEERASVWDVSKAQYIRDVILFEALLAGNSRVVKMFSCNVGDIFRQLLIKFNRIYKSDGV